MTTPEMRRLLVLAAGLVLLIGIPLFLFPGSTEDSFAWTVRPDLTAAFFGAGYWAAAVLEMTGARRERWGDARIAVPAVAVFTTATLVATLIHLDLFHFDHPDTLNRIGTWGWLVVYATVPLLLLWALAGQVRTTGWGARDRTTMAPPTRRGLGAAGAALGALGLGLLAAPGMFDAVWPWPLSALTGRAVGAWLAGMGALLAHMAWDGDWRRSLPASAAAGSFGLLQGIALVRHLGTPDWSHPEPWVYAIALVGLFALGVQGIRRAA
jgi:hypothetical protein